MLWAELNVLNGSSTCLFSSVKAMPCSWVDPDCIHLSSSTCTFPGGTGGWLGAPLVAMPWNLNHQFKKKVRINCLLCTSLCTRGSNRPHATQNH